MIALLTLAGCHPDPDCTPRTWWRDADGDGYGDPSTATSGCDAPAGHVAIGSDCDDTEVDTWPGAPTRCGGTDDDDCDGVPDADGLDGDGDGFTPCDGDCDDAEALAHPGATEVCNGLDDDCSGAIDLDDPGADPWSCGFCPDPAGFADFSFRRRMLNPCILDPTVSLCRDGVTEIDTMTDGARLHMVTWGQTQWKKRDELLLFLPPGPGNYTDRIQQWGAYTGYRVIALGWPNAGSNDASCRSRPDPWCYENLHRENLFGVDVSPHLDIAPHDSIEGRLTTLLTYLVANFPSEGWERYVEGGEVRWDRIIAAGWSEGGAEVAFLSKERELAGALLLAPGIDLYHRDGSTFGSDWWSYPAATPPERVWLMYSAWDPQAFPDDYFVPLLGLDYGVPGPPTVMDELTPPYGGSQHLSVRSLQFERLDCTTHGAIAVDDCMDESILMPAYFHAYCHLPQR